MRISGFKKVSLLKIIFRNELFFSRKNAHILFRGFVGKESMYKKKGRFRRVTLCCDYVYATRVITETENSFGVFCRRSFNKIGISTAAADNGNRLFRDEIPNRISIPNWPREMRVAQVTIRKKHTMSQSHSNLNLIILARGLRF